MENNEPALLKREAATGNKEAFATLFLNYKDKLYAFILHISNSPQIAEDVVQDVFCSIWQKREDLMYIENFNAYLFRSAHNQVLNVMKRMAKETLILKEMREQADLLQTDPFLAVEHKEKKDLVSTAINSLPRQQQLVFKLSKEEGMKQEDIAKRLDISIKTVKSHMTQALRSLRRECGDTAINVIVLIIAAAAFLY